MVDKDGLIDVMTSRPQVDGHKERMVVGAIRTVLNQGYSNATIVREFKKILDAYEEANRNH